MYRNYYVYIFREPGSNVPFYVGKGCGARLNQRRNRSAAVLARIDAVAASGLKHICEVINVPSESDAFELEIALIEIIGRLHLGTGPLLNHTKGGNGCFGKQTESGRKAISAAMCGNTNRLNKKFNDEELAKISLGVKKSLSPERLAKLRAAGLKGSQRSAELGLNKLGGNNAGAFKKGHIPHNVRGGYLSV